MSDTTFTVSFFFILLPHYEDIMIPIQNPKDCLETQPSLGLSCLNESRHDSMPSTSFPPTLRILEWISTIFIVLILSGILLFKGFPIGRIKSNHSNKHTMKDPPQLPYTIPFIGHGFSYIIDSSRLASSIV